MNCPDLEEVIAFAVAPLDPERAEIAAHVFQCGKCRSILAEANRGLLEPGGEFEVDRAKLHAALRKRNEEKRTDLWEKLKALAAALVDGTIPAAALRGQTARMLPAYTFAATRNGAAPAERSVEITFAADTDKTSDDYWQAELVIPEAVRPFTLLKISLTDGRRQPLCGGRFVFLGKVLPVLNGTAQISFQEFRSNLNNTQVSYTNARGREIAGDLIIC